MIIFGSSGEIDKGARFRLLTISFPQPAKKLRRAVSRAAVTEGQAPPWGLIALGAETAHNSALGLRGLKGFGYFECER